jgi:D-alanine-D-alanine ligase
MKNQTIGVLLGGLSAEREVSLNTGAGVLAALQERSYDCARIDWTEGTSLARMIEDAGVDVVWNALHGTYGEDGAVQGLLTCMGIPGTGSGILASALAFDKVASKRAFSVHDVPTPMWFLLDDDQGADEVTEFPCVIKPASEGSSVGVTIVHDASEVANAIEKARACRGATIVETYIPGMEIHVGILGDEVIGEVEVRPSSEFYDYQAKYTRGDTRYIVPAPIDEAARESAHEVALRAYLALGCSGHGRVDLRIDDSGEIYVLEVNTLPGMTKTSLLPKIAAHAGMDYATLCERILAGARLG